MKTFFNTKLLFILSLIFILLLNIFAKSVSFDGKKSEYISIQKLIEENQLKVDITSIGSHQENCIRFDIENKTSKSIKVLIEAGRRLNSFDSTIQDILIVKNRTIELEPYEQKLIPGYGFCCQSTKKGPKKNSKFSIGNTPKEFIELCTVIDENDFPASSLQSAVWAISNDHRVSSISAPNMNKIKKLREIVAKIKGVELPWYSISYEKDTAMLFTNKHERIFGDIIYDVQNSAQITITLRHKNGDLVAVLLDGKPSRGKQFYKLDLRVKGWPKGEYEIFVYEDYSKLNIKKTFKL